MSFATHIKPLFRDQDRQSMSFAFDLWSYDDVRARAVDILGQLRGGSMPCDAAWSGDKIGCSSTGPTPACCRDPPAKARRREENANAQCVRDHRPYAGLAGPMLVLVICRPVPDADQARFGELLAEEFAALRRLKASSALTQAWSPGRPGAVLILDVSDLPAATSLTARLPLAAAGLIATEIIPLHPLEL